MSCARGPGRDLYPPGCPTLLHAVDQLTGSLMADDMLELDGQVQAMIRERLTALVHVCLTTANVVRSVGGNARAGRGIPGDGQARMEAMASCAQKSPPESDSVLVHQTPLPSPSGAADLFLSQFPESARGSARF
jgi:hypothetical protein